MFDHFSLYVDGQEKTAALHSRKVAEMIAFLLCHAGETIDKKSVAQALWNDFKTALAMDNLYKTIKKLSLLPQHGIPLFIENTRGEIRLQTDNIESDIFSFEVWSRSKLPKDWERAAQLYRGLLLYQDCFSWCQAIEGYYDCLYLENAEKLLHYYKQKNIRSKILFWQRKLDFLNES